MAAIAKHKEILMQHPNNMECLRYLVNMCTSLGKKEEVEDYEVRLHKLEREGFAVETISQFKPTERLTKVNYTKGSYDYSSLGIGRLGLEPSYAFQVAQKPASKACAKRQRVQDDWDLVDELLPM